jgi:hypothetical protein
MIKLEKNRIYKIITTNTSFKRNYMIFALPKELEWWGESIMFRKTVFLINLVGKFKIGSDMGLNYDSKVVEPSAFDLLEVGCFLRGTKLRANIRTKKVTDIELENWEITEI